MAGATTLDQVLSGLAREGELFERLPGGRVRCHACGHRCLPGHPLARHGLVERVGYHIRQNRLTPTGGACPDCATRIAGIWA